LPLQVRCCLNHDDDDDDDDNNNKKKKKKKKKRKGERGETKEMHTVLDKHSLLLRIN